MDFRVARTESAWRELEAAVVYIAEDSPRYASAFMDEARSAARSLHWAPQRGRTVPEIDNPAIREIFVKRYRLIYEMSGQTVLIISFLHGARQFPDTTR